MSTNDKYGTFQLGNRHVSRLGYGAMQLAGPGVFGPPKDPGAALAVLREAVASGVNHIDTADYYGPHVTNQIIGEALHPYPKGLVIVTKVGARRGADASWIPAFSREELTQAVHDNLRNLGVDVLEVVNLRAMFDVHHPTEGSLEAPLTVLADLQRKGLVRHIGLSNVTPKQITDGRRICEIVCVQNYYNLAHRTDDALIDDLAGQGIAFVPFFPLGGFTPLQSSTLSDVADGWMPHRCKSRSPGCCSARRAFCLSPEPRGLRTCAKSGRSAARAYAANLGRVERDCLMSSINSHPQVGFSRRPALFHRLNP